MRLYWVALAILLVASLGVAFGLAYGFEPKTKGDPNPFVEGYIGSARTPLFTAFLTLGSFLLTLKTSILQRLREGYDTKSHEETYLSYRRNLKRGKPARYYQGLCDLSFALAAAMGSSIVTSLLQVTMGFVKSPWSTAICVGTAAFSAATVLILNVAIFRAHKQWVEYIEKEKEKTILEKLDGKPAVEQAICPLTSKDCPP